MEKTEVQLRAEVRALIEWLRGCRKRTFKPLLIERPSAASPEESSGPPTCADSER